MDERVRYSAEIRQALSELDTLFARCWLPASSQARQEVATAAYGRGFAALEQRLVGSGDRLVRMELLGVLPEPEQLHQLVPEHALPPPAA